MGRPSRLVAITLLAVIAVSLTAPQAAPAYGGIEIAAIVISAVIAVPGTVAAVIFFSKSREKKAEKKPESVKPSSEAATKPPPITVSPNQIYSE